MKYVIERARHRREKKDALIVQLSRCIYVSYIYTYSARVLDGSPYQGSRARARFRRSREYQVRDVTFAGLDALLTTPL